MTAPLTEPAADAAIVAAARCPHLPTVSAEAAPLRADACPLVRKALLRPG